MFGYYLSERWAYCPEPYNEYRVSTYGRVSNKHGKIMHHTMIQGHPLVTLTSERYHSSKKRVSWLVYNTFCGKAKLVTHYDECPTHNHYMNLVDKEDHVRIKRTISDEVARDIVRVFSEITDSREVKRIINEKWGLKLITSEVMDVIKGLTNAKATGLSPRSIRSAKRKTVGKDTYVDLF